MRIVIEVSEQGVIHKVKGARTPEQMERATKLWVQCLPLVAGFQVLLRLHELTRQEAKA